MSRAAAALLISLLAGGPRDAPFVHFEPAPEGHSWANTYLLAMASSYAYRGRVQDLPGESFAEKFQHPYGRLGLEVRAFIQSDGDDDTDTQVLVLGNDQILLVVFCGSEGHDAGAAMRDWLTDAKFWPLELEGARIHRGFHYALESIWDDLDAAVAEPLEEGLSLWLTGHSQGGALANLAAYRWHREQVPVAGVYTFAAPKIGDAAFVADFQQRLGSRSQQWSTTLDPVPRVPEITDRSAFEKLGVTNMVGATGAAELDTIQQMSGVPNPLAHRVSSYVNYFYRALPAGLRENMPPPPAQCALYTRHVGTHPEDGRPLCRDRVRRIRRQRCLDRGRGIVEPWCVAEEPGKFRYLAWKLKPGEPQAGAE